MISARGAPKLLLAALVVVAACVLVVRLPDPIGAASSVGFAVVIVFAAWMTGFLAITAVYLATSGARTHDLLAAAGKASAPAMWYVPALLFLSAGTSVAIATGLALAANATRQLFSASIPERYESDHPRRRRTARIFQNLVEQPPRHVLPLVGACSLELGVVAVIQGNLVLAALASAGVAAMWTRSAVSRGAARPRPAAEWHDTLIAVIFTIIVAVGLASVQLAAQTPREATFSTAVQQIAARLVHAYDPPATARASRSRATGPQQIGSTPGAAEPGGLPGVVLVPPPPRNVKVRVRTAGTGPKLGGGLPTFSAPVQIPFTGEYQLFAESIGKITPGSPIYRGSPLDMEYATITGALVETVAYQPLDPMFDFRQCGTLQVAIATRDSSGSATLQLVFGGKLKEVGLKFFGVLNGASEKLEYNLPDLASGERVTAIRLVFHRDERHSSHSVRVAVHGFTLVPRGGITSRAGDPRS